MNPGQLLPTQTPGITASCQFGKDIPVVVGQATLWRTCDLGKHPAVAQEDLAAAHLSTLVGCCCLLYYKPAVNHRT